MGADEISELQRENRKLTKDFATVTTLNNSLNGRIQVLEHNQDGIQQRLPRIQKRLGRRRNLESTPAPAPAMPMMHTVQWIASFCIIVALFGCLYLHRRFFCKRRHH